MDPPEDAAAFEGEPYTVSGVPNPRTLFKHRPAADSANENL